MPGTIVYTLGWRTTVPSPALLKEGSLLGDAGEAVAASPGRKRDRGKKLASVI
jgi:hypothetical protein